MHIVSLIVFTYFIQRFLHFHVPRRLSCIPQKLWVQSVYHLQFVPTYRLVQVAVLKYVDDGRFLFTLFDQSIQLVEEIHLCGVECLNQL